MKLADIKDPDNITGEVELDGIKLTVLSIDSTGYNAYVRSIYRENLVKGDKTEKNSPERQDEINRTGAAYLVKSWNLEDELTIENATELFRKKRYLSDKVYNEAHRLGKPSETPLKDSGDGAKSASGSGKKSTQKTRKASPAKSTTKD